MTTLLRHHDNAVSIVESVAGAPERYGKNALEDVPVTTDGLSVDASMDPSCCHAADTGLRVQ